jgi:hypothetical protein
MIGGVHQQAANERSEQTPVARHQDHRRITRLLAEEKGEKLARYDDTGADQGGQGAGNEKDRADVGCVQPFTPLRTRV